MVLETEARAELADAVAGDAHADLSVGDGLPLPFRACGGFDSGLTEDLLVRPVSGAKGGAGGEGEGCEGGGLEEGAAGRLKSHLDASVSHWYVHGLKTR